MDDSKNSPLYRLRHSLAHVLAQAVLQVRPKAKLAFGPPVEDGCYYDFLLEEPLSSNDFRDLEKRMRRIIQEKQVFEHRSLSSQEALTYLESIDQAFKLEYGKELLEKGNAELGFYKNGSFEDMCEGPHLEHTGQIPPDCFTIDSLAGAYWRGSEKNPQLTRVYVLAFQKKAELEDFLARRKLAEERDHRKLGKELELFTFSDQVGPGLPLWMPKGTVLREELEKFAKEIEERAGYQRVATPLIAKESLYIQSGHLPYYKDTMFPPMSLEGESDYYLKAMNCPHHHMIYSNRPRSYRELPLKLAEYGNCHRFEHSGSLSGLLRVRGMCMNDAHIYCTSEQLKEQLRETFEMCLDYYKKLRFEGIRIRLSLHDPENKEKYLDNPQAWAECESIVEQVLKSMGAEYFLGSGEAAFYGPKIDFQARTLLGREETISTTQLDFGQPERFNLTYIGEDGKEHRPYVVHRAPLSTHERFIAFLIEHFGGAFPTWMAPVQVKIVPVADVAFSYAEELAKTLRNDLFRVEVDFSSNSFNKKVREAVVEKVPNILILGGKEVDDGTVTLRRYCMKEQSTMKKEDFFQRMKLLVSKRLMDNFADEEIA